jgi:hypothetical protein
MLNLIYELKVYHQIIGKFLKKPNYLAFLKTYYNYLRQQFTNYTPFSLFVLHAIEKVSEKGS